MKSIFNHKTLITIVALLSLGVFALVVNANHSWGGYHWARMTNSFTLKLGDNLNTAAWDASLALASNDWTVSTVLDTAIVTGNGTRNCKATSGTVQVCNASYGNNGWLGLAQIWTSGSHITQGVAKMNDTYFNTTKYNTTAWRNFVMCQEIGHMFGLGHNDEIFTNLNKGTCMDYTNAPAGGIVGGFNYGPSNERPNAHDYDQLGIIYTHLDSITTIGATAFSKGNQAAVNTDDSSAWGKEIHKDSRGHSSLFERDLGKGEKVLTFVIWAE